MSTSRWKPPTWVLAGLLAAGSATADPTAALETACATVPEAPATDLAVLTQRIVAAQTATTGAGLAEACQGWRQVARNPASPALLLTEWRAQVAAALVWLGRSAEAEPLLDAAYHQYLAASPAHIDKRSMVAGMLMVIWLQRAQLDTALTWSQRAVDAMVDPGSGASLGDSLRVRLNHGSLLSRARRFDEANQLLLGLLDEALAQPDTLAPQAAAALNSLANLARRQSRLADALAYTEREIALRQVRLTQDPVNIATALHNRGLLLMSQARFDAAEAALQAALQQARDAQAAGAVDLMGHQASVRETLSGLLLARGRPAEALQVAHEAVATLAGRPEAATARGARPLRRVAEAQLALGELGEGVATYRRALALLSTTVGAPEADTALALRLGHALAMIELGELDEAATSLQWVATDSRPRSPEESARLQVLQATLAQRRGDTAAAARAWLAADQAVAAAMPPEHPDRRFIQTQACELQAAACPPTTSAAGTPDTDALTQMSLARRARAAGDAGAADAAARSAVAAALASGQPRLQWQALALWADVLADTGQRDQAIFLGKLALTRLQQQRQRLLPLGTVADARYLADKAPLYRRVADWLLQAQRIPEALEVMRLLKLQEQAEFNERGFVDAFAAGGISLSAAEQAAWQRLESALQGGAGATELRALSERAASQRITAEETARLAQLRRDEAAQRDHRAAGLNALLTGLGTQPRPSPPGRKAPTNKPPAGQLHVYTLAGEQRLSLLLMGAGGTQVHQLDLGATELARQVAALRDALAGTQSAGAVQPLAKVLYSRFGHLIDQAARRQRAGRIVVWLDGPLRYLPPGLMHDGRQPLAARYRFVVAGGLAAPQRPAARPTVAPQINAFGVTQAFQGLPALTAVADELCDIVDGPVLGLEAGSNSSCGSTARGQGPVRGQARLNGLFTEAALTRADAAPTANELLHISTHFVLRPGSIAKSWLLLGDGSRLPLERMRRIDIGRPQLVTLSACETAVMDSGGGGREVDGLAAALLDRGAGQVLASLWRVDDRATARFMQRFYTAYTRQHGDAATALQQAQRQAMAEGAPARDWAAFVLLARAGVGS
ncbi:CHAT domain-containing tetratricopeptide repeat protein [Roseateles sp. LKC17W]|uniref:CHAT domain-containing protein n=1 Tax=Pelomonas margarita TaxID=3299031 RepID=A0ABW7FHV9_9BURK